MTAHTNASVFDIIGSNVIIVPLLALPIEAMQH
jgi:hypothetical protein